MLASIRDAMREEWEPRAYIEGLCASLEDALDAIEALNAQVSPARERTPADVIESISLLPIKKGDILVVKLGDKNTGWIPGPEAEQRAIELFSDAMAQAGHAEDITMVFCHYGHELEIIRGATEVRVKEKE